LRKQWALELEEKFNLPTVVLDAKTWRDILKKDQSPINQKTIIILSYNYANYSGPRFSDSDLRWKPVMKRGL
jgi:hypothetical protein